MTAALAIWWRDDDAIEDSPALRRLIAIKDAWNVPLALAVIPQKIQQSLGGIVEEADLDILVHGYAHQNHAPIGAKKAEYEPARSFDDMRGEWIDGQTRLKAAIPRTLPIFVPPWNRFPHDSLIALKDSGYKGFSAWGDEANWPGNSGLLVSNTHIDVIDWRNGAQAKSARTLLAELGALAESSRHSLNKPIGILTHHRQMSDAAFDALEEMFFTVAQSRSFVWTGARSIFRCRE